MFSSKNKWKNLGGVKKPSSLTIKYGNRCVKLTYNELKISKDFKFSIAGDTNDLFKISPQFKRRWMYQGAW